VAVSDVSDLFDSRKDGVVVRVHVQPGAGRTAVSGRHGAALKLRVAAPPADGRANEEVVALLARTLGVKPAAVTIESGATSRVKRVKVDGVEADTVAASLRRAIADATTSGPVNRR
jgi:uncharacterized protein (TIGR00251 family)